MRSKSICVLTQPLWTNYGALLQAWALQTEIANSGFEVVTDAFPRRFPSFAWRNADRAKRLVGHYLLGRKSVNPNPFYFSPKEWQMVSENTTRFVSENIRTVDFFAGETFPTDSMLREFDTFVCGSDQVWRKDYGRVESYFFDFAEREDKKLFSYAASFGLSKWQFDKAETERLRHLAARFQALSVREEDALGLCERFLGREATWVCDPTLLCSAQDYKDLIDKGDTKPSEGNLKTYFLDKTPWKTALVKRLEEKRGLKAFSVTPKRVLGVDTRRFSPESVYPSPQQWLRGFAEADYVLTDSFHGTVFSIIFERPFIVVANKGRGIGRLRSLLSICGLEDRMVFEGEAVNEDLFETKVDFGAVRERLEGFVAQSRSFLIGNLED